MSKIIFLLMVISQSLYAATEATYLLEWDKGAKEIELKKARDILIQNNKNLKANGWKLRMSDAIAAKLLKTNAFKYIEKDRTQTLKKIDYINEPINNKDVLARDWHLDRMRVEQAWKTTRGNPSVIVAICDSGINQDLVAFKGKILKGWNFIDGDTDTSPNTGHGTAVASYVAASDLDGTGLSGVAPDVTLLPGKIVTTSGGVPTSAMVGCVRWAASRGAKVINVSMTGVNSSSSQSAARYANSKGAIVVWAAGNQNWATSWKDKKEIIAVGGSDYSDKRYQSGTFGSNTGDFVDITAPGEDVYFLTLDGNYRKSNGTSFSAPMVSGIAALLYSIKPTLTPSEALRYIKRGATKIGDTKSFGAGLINARKSIELLQNEI